MPRELLTGYPVPAAEAEAEVEDRRSRFIGSAGPADSVEAAKGFIDTCRRRYPDASHHVYAFAVGHGATVVHGMSDDGEPSGTAGRPCLAVVKGSGLGDVAVVVTRYFGGTKLGTGGLVRAYTAATQAVLEQMPRSRKVVRLGGVLRLPYDCYEPCRRVVERFGAEVTAEEFGTEAVLHVQVEEPQLEDLCSRIRDMTSGRVTLEIESPDQAD